MTLGASPAAQAAPRGDWGCNATAIRGTVLGQSVGSPTANAGGGVCADGTGSVADAGALPLPLSIGAVTAATRVLGAGAARDRRNVAVGGVANLGVRALPELPIQLPTRQVLDQLPPVAITVPSILGPIPPLTVAVDIRSAVEALLPDGRLPRLDLVTVDAITATAFAACNEGAPVTFGVSQVTGLKVLGQDTPLDSVTSQVLNLNTAQIDLSNIDISKVVLPAGVPLGLTDLRRLLQPVLDALPPIALPEALARVKVTPGAQETLPDGTLVQRGTRIEVGIAGTSIADLVIGEAAVSGRDVVCAAPPVAVPDPAPTATDLVLGCSTRRIVLTDVVPTGRRVRLTGAADRRLAGRRVRIRFAATGRTVAQPVVAPDGTFSALAPLPSRKVRSSNRARYRASIGTVRSLDLKLERRMRVSTLRRSGTNVVLTGRISRPLAATAGDRMISIERRISCTRTAVVAQVFPRADGTFTATFASPEDAGAAVYRVKTKVRKTTRNSKVFPTFTVPKALDLL